MLKIYLISLDIDLTSSDIINSGGDIMDELYDINSVCKMLGITSRTLRFYEEKGIISSTKNPFSCRRSYNKEQLKNIKNVLVLRSIGISVNRILALKEEKSDLKSEIIAKKAEILASIENKQRNLFLLEEAISLIDDGDDLFEEKIKTSYQFENPTLKNITTNCAMNIADGNIEYLYSYFNQTMMRYKSKEALALVVSDVLLPLGKFICIDKIDCDKKFTNIFYVYLKYENLGLKIKFVFSGEKISGLWLDYYKL